MSTTLGCSQAVIDACVANKLFSRGSTLTYYSEKQRSFGIGAEGKWWVVRLKPDGSWFDVSEYGDSTTAAAALEFGRDATHVPVLSPPVAFERRVVKIPQAVIAHSASYLFADDLVGALGALPLRVIKLVCVDEYDVIAAFEAGFDVVVTDRSEDEAYAIASAVGGSGLEVGVFNAGFVLLDLLRAGDLSAVRRWVGAKPPR